MAYSDRHRIFLQAISNNGVLELSAALSLLNSLNEKYDISTATEDDLTVFINQINEVISELDQKIRRIRHEITKKYYIVFTNTIEDEINKKQSFYNEMDREYFRLILQEITINDNTVQRIAALNLISDLKPKPFSKNHAEDLLEDWINGGYFIEENNLLYFGPRTLCEFSNYLAENFADHVKKCQLCMATVLMGTSCAKCDEFFHRDCLRKALVKSLTCPACKDPWNRSVDH